MRPIFFALIIIAVFLGGCAILPGWIGTLAGIVGRGAGTAQSSSSSGAWFPDDVIVCGHTEKAGFTNAWIWSNGNVFPLSGSAEVIAWDLAIHPAGYIVAVGEDNGYACYWSNAVKFSLGPVFYDSSAVDVCINGSTVIIAANYTTNSGYWTNGIYIPQTDLPGTVTNYATGVASYGDNIFLTGIYISGIASYGFCHSNGWSILDAGYNSEIHCVYAGPEGYFLGGMSNSVPCVWNSGTAVFQGGATGNVYDLLYLNSATYGAGLSSTPSAVFFTNGIPYTLTNVWSSGNGIAIKGTNYYICGTILADGTPFVWHNGVFRILTNLPAGSRANGIAVR